MDDHATSSESKVVRSATRAETEAEALRLLSAYVEESVLARGESPTFELKRSWNYQEPFQKAELVKDIQSIANSDIPEDRQRMIVVGVDEKTRVFSGCIHAEYDEDQIRKILEAHLDTVPRFEVLHLKTLAGAPYVVLRLPHQPDRPFVVKKEIRVGPKQYLRPGEIWYKPGTIDSGATGKRLATSSQEILRLVDLEPRVQGLVAVRIADLAPAIRSEERSRLGGEGFGPIPVLTSKDEELEGIIEQIVARRDKGRMRILGEKLHEPCIEPWKRQTRREERLTAERILEIKEREFLPALRKTVLAGLSLIRFGAPGSYFKLVADVLMDAFDVSAALNRKLAVDVMGRRGTTLGEQANHAVPAVESLLAAHVLIGYGIRKGAGVRYARSFFPRLVTLAEDYNSSLTKSFFLFWSYGEFGPDRWPDNLAAERYAIADRIDDICGGDDGIRHAVWFAEALLSWHEFLGHTYRSRHALVPETRAYFADTYPDGRLIYNDCFYKEHLAETVPALERLWSALKEGKQGMFALDRGLEVVLRNLDVGQRRQLFGAFLNDLNESRANYASSHGTWFRRFSWPEELADIAGNAPRPD